MSENETDKALVNRFQRGDRKAFETFVRRHQDRIYRLAMVSLHSNSQAADVTQDVFLRALTGLRGFRFGAEPFTWLYRTLKNVVNEYNRKAMPHQYIADTPPSDHSLENDVDEAQRARQIRDMVCELPERQRDVVLLRVFEELSIADTAATLRCRPGTVKALLHQALQQLRKDNRLER